MSAPYLDLPIRSKNCAQDCQVLGVCHSLPDCQEAAAMQRIEAQAMQRMAERKARELAAGRVHWKRWVHPDDVPALTEYADKLARKRARAEKAGQRCR